MARHSSFYPMCATVRAQCMLTSSHHILFPRPLIQLPGAAARQRWKQTPAELQAEAMAAAADAERCNRLRFNVNYNLCIICMHDGLDVREAFKARMPGQAFATLPNLLFFLNAEANPLLGFGVGVSGWTTREIAELVEEPLDDFVIVGADDDFTMPAHPLPSEPFTPDLEVFSVAFS